MAIAFVNSGTAGLGDGTTSTVVSASAINLSGGNFVVVGVRHDTSSGVAVTVDDTAGNTYSSVTRLDMTPTDGMRLFYKANALGNASNVVTAHFGTPVAYYAITAAQFSGMGAATVDTKNTSSGGSTVLTSANFNTAQASELLIGYGNAAGQTLGWVPTGGASSISEDPQGGTLLEYKILSSTVSSTNMSMRYTAAGVVTWGMITAAFIPSGAGTGSKGGSLPLLGVQ